MNLNARQRLDEAHRNGRHASKPESDCFGCAFSKREAYGIVAAEMYAEGEEGYIEPVQVLCDLEPSIVRLARQYANENGIPWPPAPVGLMMTLYIQ